MSLLNLAVRLANKDRSKIEFDRSQCLHSQNQFSKCEACFGVCPVNAIKSGKPPIHNQELCQSCLACIPACPVGAYQADDYFLSLLNCVMHTKGKTVELLCGLHPKPKIGNRADQVGILLPGCLAGLGIGSYLTFFALGLESIFVRTDACQTCKWQCSKPSIQRQIQQANHVLSGWRKAETIIEMDNIETPEKRPVWDVKNPTFSRRGLFNAMVQKGKVAIASNFKNEEMMTTDKSPGPDRLRLINAIVNLPDLITEFDTPMEYGNLATLNVSDSCNACAACTRTCPTSALTFEANTDQTYYKLNFDAKRCIGCELCLSVCVPKAIEINHHPTFSQVFSSEECSIISEGRLAKCTKCNTLFAPKSDRELCAICEYRKKNLFGSIVNRGWESTTKT